MTATPQFNLGQTPFTDNGDGTQTPLFGLKPGAGATAADAAANPTAPFVLGAEHLFNGTTWDRWRAAIGTTGVAAVNTEGTKATYTAANSIALAASATNVLTIGGSASKTVRLVSIEIIGTATSNTNVSIALRKQSTADTGGTSASPNLTPHDSTSPAATASVVQYSANPTQGTVAGFLGNGSVLFNGSSPAAVVPYVKTFGTKNEQAAILRGTAQQIAVTLSGVTVTGGILQYSITWTEE